MQTHLIQVFPKTEDLAWLRWFDAANQLRDERPLDILRVMEFVNAVEREYQTHAPQLGALGRRLYEWLDGPTERWLEQARQDTRELAVHLDVESRAWGETRLRHLPWELVYDGAFLCADAARPFTPVRRVGNGRRAAEIANRPLRVLFMASSPTDIQPVLAFEREEALILDATHKRPLELRVEESGSLEGLSERIADHAAGYFDIFHLTGHAAIQNGAPVFILENKFGTHQTATADDLARAFGGRFPRLVFLSGCRTGQAPFQGVVPSFSERLVAAGAPAVLGWALPVGDAAATLAAAELYEQLGQGKRIDEAVTRARQKLFQAQSPYWHLLRLYADATPLSELVTPLKTPGRDIVRVRRADLEFLDERAKVGSAPVCPRQEFVGRRRLLQRGLRILTSAQGDEEYAEGVVLHGAGGLGKSSAAARLCERLPDFMRLVSIGGIDEHGFVRVLNEKPNDAAIIQINQNEQLALKQRLALILDGPLATRPVLFVFDDFEQNLEETADGMRRMSENARNVIEPLLGAIHATNSASRILITSRYTFAVPPAGRLAELSLERLYDAELDKKTRQLDALDQSAPELKTRALALGAGNPRLMEYLNRVLADKDADHAALLNRLEGAAEKYREEISLPELLNALTEKGRGVLARAAVYALPVARAGIQAAAGDLEMEPYWTRAVALGLVERGGEPETNEPRDAVSELCKPLLVDEIDETETRAAGARAARYLHQAGAANERELLEVYRLALLGGEREIAVVNGDRLATRWVNAARYREAERLAELTRELGDDYRILHTLARAQQVLGKTQEARENYEKALAQCPEENVRVLTAVQVNLAQLVLQTGQVSRALDLWQQALVKSEQLPEAEGKNVKAATLHNMAGVVAQQGDVTRALALWNESLQASEQIGDVKGKAATLHNMAGVFAQQGDVTRALALWNESLQLKEQIGNVQGKAATLHQMARIIAQQGDVTRALALWNESLQASEQIGDVKGKAATLHNMAGVFAQQGDVTRALALWNESLQLKEQIGDVKGKAATLHNMAGVFAQQGDVTRALALWNESLQLKEQIGDVQGKAATLANMGSQAFRDGDIAGANELFVEVARTLASIHAYLDLVTVLRNLGVSDAENALNYLAQAFWLTVRVQVSAQDTLDQAGALVENIGAAHPAAPLVAITAFFLAQQRGAEHPEKEKLLGYGMNLILACAETRGIAEDRFVEWFEGAKLNDPAYFLPALDAALVEWVGEGEWLFERGVFGEGLPTDEENG